MDKQGSSKIRHNYLWYDPEFWMISELEKNSAILELGCGMGRYERLIPRIVGVDNSTKFIDYCKRNIPGGKFVKADASRVPFPNDSFDCVFSSGVIEHYDEGKRMQMVKEHIRLARKGGRVIITVPARDTPDFKRHENWLNLIAKGKEREWQYFGQRVSDQNLKSLFTKADLRNVRVFHLGIPMRYSKRLILTYTKKLMKHPSSELLHGLFVEMIGFFTAVSFRFSKRNAELEANIKKNGYYLVGEGIK